MISFGVSGVEVWWWLPVVVAAGVSFFTSMAGVSGAFLLLPFQMTVLGYTAPSVSATNMVFNLVATPGGIVRFWRDRRMAWPLVGTITAGSLPGVVAGYALRTGPLSDLRPFTVFVGMVLLLVCWRLFHQMAADATAVRPADVTVHALPRQGSRLWLLFDDGRYCVDARGLAVLSMAVVAIGGAYGIGGGALMAPLCVAVFRLPVHAVAGACLFATFVTSAFGIAVYSVLPAGGVATAPDWPLGLLFGIGGTVGTYLGAVAQRFLSQQLLVGALIIPIAWLGVHYLAMALALFGS